MAYTKAPVNDTHNVLRIPVQGSPIAVTNTETGSATPPTLNFIDCFTKAESQWGTDPERRLHKREGFEAISVTGTITASTDFSRSIVCANALDNVAVAYNNSFILIEDFSTATPSATVLSSSITGTTENFTGTLAVDSSNTNKLCFLTDAGFLHTWNEDGTGATSTDLSLLNVTGEGNLVFLNGYLFGVSTDGKIYNSNVGGVLTTWSSTDFLTPEIYPDFAQYIDKHKNYLVAFSQNSVEFFYDGGVEVGSPLVRQESYASKIGIVSTPYSGASTTRIGDDIYFVGKTENDSYSLYRISNFKVEEINNQYVQNCLNFKESAGTYQTFLGIQTLNINNNPMICISGSKGYDLIYYPDENCWWQIRCDGDTERGLTEVNTDFPGLAFRLSGTVFPTVYSTRPTPRIIAKDPAGGNSLKLYTPAVASPPSIQADVYTEVIDLGINYYKHIARIDAVGDYGNNTITLYYNGTPNYGQTYVECTPSKTPSTAGYQYNASWYNLGAYRRISYRLKMVGTGPAFHTALDMEYNSGAS